MMTTESEVLLSAESKCNDTKARNDLVTRNIGLAYYFVNKYKNRGISFQDLLSAGYLGLLNAAMNYDPDRGSFGTCAWVYIKQYIFNEFRKNRLIQFPAQRLQHLLKIGRAREKLVQKLKRVPVPEEIADETGLPIEDVSTVLENESIPVSIFQESNNGGRPLIEALNDDVFEDEPELQNFEIKERLSKLSQKERTIIYLYLWNELTFEEIGQRFGKNRETIRLCIKKVLKKLKKN